jgi:hypothetical protein
MSPNRFTTIAKLASFGNPRHAQLGLFRIGQTLYLQASTAEFGFISSFPNWVRSVILPAVVLHGSRPSPPATILVGRAPWPAADPLVGLLEARESRTRGSGADEGVRPTFGLRLCCLVGQDSILLAGFQSAKASPAAGPPGAPPIWVRSVISPFTRPKPTPTLS